MEKLYELQGRIGGFGRRSLDFGVSDEQFGSPEYRDNPNPGPLDTRFNDRLTCKIDENGRMKPFPGNTVVFTFEEEDNKTIQSIQDMLYADAELARALFTADRLKAETYHMTLHDLANPTTAGEGKFIENTRERALEILKKIKDNFGAPIKMRPRWILNMLNISLLLYLEPESEEDCRRLMEIYERFHEVVMPGFPYLTPHVTLAYYRPMQASWKQLNALRKIVYDYNEGNENKPVFQLRGENLFYQEFDDMNTYRSIEEA